MKAIVQALCTCAAHEKLRTFTKYRPQAYLLGDLDEQDEDDEDEQIVNDTDCSDDDVDDLESKVR